MDKQQKDLLRDSLENEFKYIDDNLYKLNAMKDFERWLFNLIKEKRSLDLVMSASSKHSLLQNYKKQIGFSQKDFMEITKVLQTYSDCVYDDNLNVVSPKGDQRFYRIDKTHPKYKHFMLSVGLIDSNCISGYIVPFEYSITLSHFIRTKNTKNFNVTSIIHIHNSIRSMLKYKFPSNVYEFSNYRFHFGDIVNAYDEIEGFGLELLRTVIQDILDSEKSK